MNAARKPRVLVTREVFDETLAYLRQHCEVRANQDDMPYAPAALAAAVADRDGLMCCLTDRVDAALLAAAPDLKAVANIAVGYNNIDVPACTARGVMATNTPGVLDDSTADLAWALMLGTARRITEVERRAVRDAALNAGARWARLVEEPMAAAIGIGFNRRRKTRATHAD